MKVLIISYWFPPQNIIGALRVGKLAKYLHANGHEVRVLAARTSGNSTLPLEIPADFVTYTGSSPSRGPLDPIIKLTRKASVLYKKQGNSPASTSRLNIHSGPMSSLRETLTWHYYATFQIPDGFNRWMSGAIAAGDELLRQWRPDLIYASAPPFSALVVASKLSEKHGLPWVAELRDLWAENPYYEFPAWRRCLDRRMERKTLSASAALVTVTPIWAEVLHRTYSQPVSTILNGYSAEDLPADTRRRSASDIVTIAYTGNIYKGYRDPSALFQAIGQLGPKREKVVVNFYGPTEADVDELARKFGVRDRVFVKPPIPHREALAIQRDADVLLLMQWNDKRDEGNIPAKLFEYLAVLRPILFLGYEQGTVAQIIRDRGAGLVSNSPERIARQLAEWIEQRASGIPGLPVSAREGLAREEQFRRLEKFIDREVLANRRHAPCSARPR